jgi:hypothetical protein
MREWKNAGKPDSRWSDLLKKTKSNSRRPLLQSFTLHIGLQIFVIIKGVEERPKARY